LFIFRSDVNAAQISNAMRGFTKLVELEVLTNNDISNLARQIHFRYRTEKDLTLLVHVKTLVEAIKSKKVPGHPLASVHILSCLKDMEEWQIGNEFWAWLRTQDEEITDSRVYGSAIELFTFQGTPLNQLEALYQQAHKLYGTVPHDGGGTMRRPTRGMLMQGIITARLFHDEWRLAYKALSHCVRHHPTQTPARVYELFILMRPAIEGHIVFMMACRAGVNMPTKVCTNVAINYLREEKDAVGTLQLICAYAAAGGKLEIEHLNLIIKALFTTCPTPPSSSTTDISDESIKSIFQLINKTVAIFHSQGIPMQTATYNTVISEGGRLRCKDLVHNGLNEMLKAKIEPTLITYRCLIQALASIGEKDEVRECWHTLSDLRAKLRMRASGLATKPKSQMNWKATSQVLTWDNKDWQALIKACLMTDQIKFFESQFKTHAGELSIHQQDTIMDLVRSEGGRISRQMKADKLKADMKKSITDAESDEEEVPTSKLYQALNIIIDKLHKTVNSATRADVINDPFLLGTSTLGSQDEETKKLYHEFTKREQDPDTMSSPLGRDDEPKTTITGLSYNDLRFLNWMSINKALYLAETREEQDLARLKAMDSKEGDKETVHNLPKQHKDARVRATGYSTENAVLERIMRVKQMMRLYDMKKKKGENVDDLMTIMRSHMAAGAESEVNFDSTRRGKPDEKLVFGGEGGRQIGS